MKQLRNSISSFLIISLLSVLFLSLATVDVSAQSRGRSNSRTRTTRTTGNRNVSRKTNNQKNTRISNARNTATPEKLFKMGVKYDEEENYAEAVKWYRKAAEQGHAPAQYELGECYYYGYGVQKDYSEAVRWYRKAAEQGNADAQNSLGYCYTNGNGVTQNYSEAVKWYRKAAEQGNASAQNNLGVCYHDGHGVTRNYSEAAKWYRKAAEQGNETAQNNLKKLKEQQSASNSQRNNGNSNNTRSNRTFTVNGVSFTMIYVQGGTFNMGAILEEERGMASSSEYPVHRVTLSGYYIGQTEVTQELWQAVMGNNPSITKGNKRPVEYVTWYECQTFINKLNSLTGQNFRLPTEAEWEFAARGGNKSRGYMYSGSNILGNVAWYIDNGGRMTGKTHDVATKAPNELGIYDMSGNVNEWCQDWYSSSYYSSSPSNNPKGPSSMTKRVLRGGYIGNYAQDCRVASRTGNSPTNGSSRDGLRLAL